MQHHTRPFINVILVCAVVAVFAMFPPQAFSALPEYVLIGQWSAAGPGSFLNEPKSIAADRFGNVYVADTGNNRIVKYSAGGRFKTAWGSYGPREGQFRSPQGIAVDGVGNVYIADTENQRIQKFTSAVDGVGNVYIADTENQRIQKFTSYGEFITQWQSECLYIAAAPNGDVYATRSNGTELFSPDGEPREQWRGLFKLFVRDIAVAPSGDVYVIEGSRIHKYTPEGDLLTAWGSFGGGGPGKFKTPSGLAVDREGAVYVADTFNRRIQKFSPIGEFITEWWYLRGPLQDLLVFPVDLAVDPDGYVYVVAGSKVLVFAPFASLFKRLMSEHVFFPAEAP